MKYLGLSKTMFNSGISLIEDKGDSSQLLTLITERWDRQKYSGAWPAKVLQQIKKSHELNRLDLILENRDVMTPTEKEEMNDQHYPFYEFLKNQDLEKFVHKNNPQLKFVSHHLCHAWASALFSPFEKCLILVVDGSGSRFSDLELDQKMKNSSLQDENLSYECYSLYAWNGKEIKLLEKNYHQYQKTAHGPLKFSEGLGSMYEKVAQFIFNEPTASGKVMGLAAFGKPVMKKQSHFDFLNSLNWNNSFNGQRKKEWQESPHLEMYKQVAAEAQWRFEEEWLHNAIELKKNYPEYDQLILAGGCALNCTANWKLYQQKIFKDIYVTPFPGDESISIGLVARPYLEKTNKNVFRQHQISFWGEPLNAPQLELNQLEILKAKFEVVEPEDIASFTAELISQGHVVGWFQSRSEIGPRALGHRSILCRPDTGKAKEHLNKFVKFREDFRPYGSTVLFEHAARFFETPRGFDNSFMSFAVPVKGAWKELLSDIVHKDGTCRMQTLKSEQDKLYYQLLKEVEERIGMALVLNTSLNIMGQPILETFEDLLEFLEKVNLTGVAYGNVFVYTKAGTKAPLLAGK